MDWLNNIAQTIINIIARANYGTFPESLDDWRTVANRFGIKILIVRHPTACSACLLDDILIVIWHRDLREIMRRICHEIAEFLLYQEWESPFIVPYSVPKHIIARNIELCNV